MATEIYRIIGSSVDSVTAAFVDPTVTKAIDLMGPTIAAGLVLYIMIKGYNIVLGGGHDNFADFMQRAIKMSIITMLFLNADNYKTYVVSLFDHIQTEFIASLVYSATSDATGVAVDTSSVNNIYGLLDNSLTTAFDLAAEAWANVGWDTGFGPSLAWTICALIIIVAGIIITAVGAATVIGAKFLLAVLFAIGPVFFVALMFPLTARFFEGWFSQVLNFSFTIIFVGILAGFGNLMFTDIISGSKLDGSASPLAITGEIFVSAFVLYWAQKHIMPVVGVLTGGFSIAAATFSSMMHNPISAAINRGMGALNSPSTRWDASRGQYVKDSRAGHFLRGNTMMNQGYRDHVRANWRGNWGTGGNIKRRR